MTNKEQIKKAMIDLIKKSSEFEENFIFERLQDYMDFSNGEATWKSNVRLRMLENKEVKEKAEKEKQEQSENFERLLNNMKQIIERIDKNKKSRLRYLKKNSHKKKRKENVNKQSIERNAQKRILQKLVHKYQKDEEKIPDNQPYANSDKSQGDENGNKT